MSKNAYVRQILFVTPYFTESYIALDIRLF